MSNFRRRICRSQKSEQSEWEYFYMYNPQSPEVPPLMEYAVINYGKEYIQINRPVLVFDDNIFCEFEVEGENIYSNVSEPEFIIRLDQSNGIKLFKKNDQFSLLINNEEIQTGISTIEHFVIKMRYDESGFHVTVNDDKIIEKGSPYVGFFNNTGIYCWNASSHIYLGSIKYKKI